MWYSTKAYKEGYAAARDETCPYPFGSTDYYRWINGRDDGARPAETEKTKFLKSEERREELIEKAYEIFLKTSKRDREKITLESGSLREDGIVLRLTTYSCGCCQGEPSSEVIPWEEVLNNLFRQGILDKNE